MKTLCGGIQLLLLLVTVMHIACMENEGNVHPYLSRKGLYLVENALQARPDKFDEYFYELLPADRVLLTKISGQYSDNPAEIMLHEPEVTKRLIEVYITDKDLRAYVKSFLEDEDKDSIRNHCKERFILSKQLLGLKMPIINPLESVLGLLGSNPFDHVLANDIDLQSLFINGYHSSTQSFHPIPSCIDAKTYPMYAHCFITDYCEFRVTGTVGSDFRQPVLVPLSKECLLWVVDHKNPKNTFSTVVTHADDIKGCCFSKTGTEVEYIVTYSDKDIVFSTVTMAPDGCSYVKSIHADVPNNGTIVQACFNPILNVLEVCTYEGLNNVFREWNMDGIYGPWVAWPFKQYGLLDQLFIIKDSEYGLVQVCLFGVAAMYSLTMYNNLGTAPYTYLTSKSFKSIEGHNTAYAQQGRIDNNHFVKKNNSVFMYNLRRASAFAAIEAAKKKQAQASFFESVRDAFSFEPDTECHRRYSPDGKFLLCNVLKKKSGMLYVETQIQDAVTHKPITTIDTLYSNFVGVGFNDESTELIFLNHSGPNEKVSLYNDKDKKILEEFESLTFTNCAVTSVLKRLCKECKEKGLITLSKNDPVRAMLMDWWRSGTPEMKKFLELCFPLNKIEAGNKKI